MNPEPIFIAGPDRSGTTLLFALLASHPNISMTRRTNMWRYFHGRYGDLSQPENLEHCLGDMVRYKRMGVVNPDPERIRREFLQGEPSYGRLFELFYDHHAEATGKARWGDKSLHTEHYAERVFAEFPTAKIIHMTRDPRDRYASVKKRHGRTVNRVGASVGRWLLSMRAGQRNLRRHPDQYMFLRFESLASRPEETLRQVCAFIGEEYAPAMLTMSGAVEHRDTGGNSSFGTIAPGEISTKPIGRFREVLSPGDIAYIQLFARREMQALDYPLEPVRLSLEEEGRFLAELPINVARMTGWSLVMKRMLWRGERIPPRRMESGLPSAMPSISVK
jgi:hypothetical protein